VKKNTLNPVYNEALVFDVPQENVEDIALMIKVIDYDRYVKNIRMNLKLNISNVSKDWLIAGLSITCFSHRYTV
jgi:Ca2+-dependent lipid-binding protein